MVLIYNTCWFTIEHCTGEVSKCGEWWQGCCSVGIVRCQRGANITTRGHHIPHYTAPGHWPLAGSLINRCIEINRCQCSSSSYTHNKYCIDVEEEDSLLSSAELPHPIIVLVSPHPRVIISILLRLPTLTHGCKHFSVSVIKYVRAPFVYTSVTPANMEPCDDILPVTPHRFIQEWKTTFVKS